MLVGSILSVTVFLQQQRYYGFSDMQISIFNRKVKYTYICIPLYNDSSLKHSGMACVNEGSHSFTCHPHVYPQVE